MQADQIMAELAAPNGLPEAAIRAAVAQREEVVLVLVRAIEAATADPAAEDTSRIFFIFHILGELGAKEAYRPLTRLLQLPTEQLDNLLSDAITETASRVMVRVFDGDPAPLQAVVENPEADEFVRTEMLRALAALARQGAWDREAAATYLRGLAGRLEPQGESHVWVGFLEAVVMLGLAELRPRVVELFEREWIDPTIMDVEDFEADLEATTAAPDELPAFYERPLEPFTDTVGELSRWHAFSGEPEPELAEDELGLDELDFPGSHAPAINPWRHVGRNDPCPCGSGKKFKKCCLPNVEAGLL
jgi:hypothetical protein